MDINERREGNGQIGELGELRIKLDQMTERISSRFKDRSRFPLNETVYQPGGVSIAGRPGISLLQFAIEGLESYHASLGRYDYTDQHPVLGLNLPISRVERTVKQTPLPQININISNSLISFYKDLMLKYCKPGDNPESYGETAYIDADLIQLIHERVNIGRFVADAKGRNDPTIYQLTSDDELLTKLKDRTREEALIERVRGSAETYQFDPNMAEEAFRWMIDRTIDIEIAYIHQAVILKSQL